MPPKKMKPMLPRHFLFRWMLTHLIVMLTLTIPNYIATLIYGLFVLLLHGAITYVYPLFMYGIQEVVMRRFFSNEEPRFWKWWGLSSSLLWGLGFFISTLFLSEQWYEVPDAMLAIMLMWGVPLLLQTARLQRHFKFGFVWLIAGLLAAATHGWLVTRFLDDMEPFAEQLPFIIIGVVLIQSGLTGSAIVWIHRQQEALHQSQ